MRIVHEADQWLRFGVVGEQAEHGHPDQESIGRPAAGNSERCAERVALWTWQSFELIEERQTKLVERSEGQLHLGFRAGCSHHPTSGRVHQQILQQGALPDPRLASHHNRRACAGACIGEQLIQSRALGATAD